MRAARRYAVTEGAVRMPGDIEAMATAARLSLEDRAGRVPTGLLPHRNCVNCGTLGPAGSSRHKRAMEGRKQMKRRGRASVCDRVRTARATVQKHARRVAELGGWDERVGVDTLLARIPEVDDAGQTLTPGIGGFDAGIACALDLIPRRRQALAARLHAAYTPAAVEQARTELSNYMSPDDETCWWLAACHVCVEGPVDAATFLRQLAEFEQLTQSPAARLVAAAAAYADMQRGYDVRDGLPIAHRNGGMQGAYLAGYDLVGQYADGYQLWFLGTFRTTLGLEQFAWREPGNPDATDRVERLGRSGPVFGSRQFVKCTDADEFVAAAAAARPSDE